MKQKICIITGPTAVGKSDISIKVAKSLNGEIISADSAQVYKYMNIGTAKLQKKEMQGVEHYMIDEVYPDEDFSVAIFRDKAEQYIKKITDKGKLPILVGGTGLYINSLLNNLDFTSSIIDEEYRKKLRDIAVEKGNEYLHSILKKVDPISYNKIHPNDIKRVVRSLEVYKHTKKPISFFQIKSKKQLCKYEFAYICLNMNRQKIYDRINTRVDKMIEKGLVEEVENLLKMGYNKELISMQAIGYKEIINYIENKSSLEEAINTLKVNTRRYAKRQLTWFRADDRIFWINIDGYKRNNDIIESILRYAAGKITLI